MLIVRSPPTDSPPNQIIHFKNSSFKHEEFKPFGSDPYVFVGKSNSDHFYINLI